LASRCRNSSKVFSVSDVDGTSLWVSRAQPFAAKSQASWICLENGSMSG